MHNEAFELLRSGVADAEAIDTAMRLGAHHPMGPLTLADMVGLDVILAATETLSNGMDRHKYAASPLLKGSMSTKAGLAENQVRGCTCIPCTLESKRVNAR